MDKSNIADTGLNEAIAVALTKTSKKWDQQQTEIVEMGLRTAPGLFLEILSARNNLKFVPAQVLEEVIAESPATQLRAILRNAILVPARRREPINVPSLYAIPPSCRAAYADVIQEEIEDILDNAAYPMESSGSVINAYTKFLQDVQAASA